MMKFDSPDDVELREVAKEMDWSVGAPEGNFEASEKQMNDLESRVHRTKSDEGKVNRLVTVEERSSSTGVRNFRIDFSLLQKLLYEHRRYSEAQGFSDPEMDVLRAIEFHDGEIVFVKEIMEKPHCKEYSESTVFRSLRRLQEKELISKPNEGAYKYTGP
jgi:hypothetical protein